MRKDSFCLNNLALVIWERRKKFLQESERIYLIAMACLGKFFDDCKFPVRHHREKFILTLLNSHTNEKQYFDIPAKRASESRHKKSLA